MWPVGKMGGNAVGPGPHKHPHMTGGVSPHLTSGAPAALW